MYPTLTQQYGETGSFPLHSRRIRTRQLSSNLDGQLSSLLGPVDPSFRALSGRLKFTVRRHKFNKDFLSLGSEAEGTVSWIQVTRGSYPSDLVRGLAQPIPFTSKSAAHRNKSREWNISTPKWNLC